MLIAFISILLQMSHLLDHLSKFKDHYSFISRLFSKKLSINIPHKKLFMQEHAHKDIQEMTKAKEIKNKGDWTTKYEHFSIFIVPIFALFWRTILEMTLWSWLDESYSVGLSNMSIFAGANRFWIMFKTFCSKGSFWHLA